MKMQLKVDNAKQAVLTLRGTLEEVSEAMDKITRGAKVEEVEDGRKASTDIN